MDNEAQNKFKYLSMHRNKFNLNHQSHRHKTFIQILRTMEKRFSWRGEPNSKMEKKAKTTESSGNQMTKTLGTSGFEESGSGSK